MSSFARAGVAVCSVLLISITASPITNAQTAPFAGIFQTNSSGSYLGIQMDDVTGSNMGKFKLTNEKGVIVRSVERGTPAEKAGLHEDDVIVDFAGTPVWSSSQFKRLVQETPVGRKVDLVVSRDGKKLTVTAEIGKRQEGRSQETYQGQLRNYPDFRFSEPDEYGILVRPSARPRLGLSLQPLSEQLAEHLGVPGKKGALVSSVVEGTPSAGKIHAGDIIIAADGKNIESPEDLTRVVRDKSEGTVVLRLIRDKKELTIELTLSPKPSEGRDDGGLRL